MINVLLIGCGYHARRIYVPHLAEQKNARLSAIVDLASQKEKIEGFLTEKTITGIDFYYTDNNTISDDLSLEEVKNLNNLVVKQKIDAVIISTEPLAHFKYAKWALNHDLHVLMDKPITTEYDVSTNTEKAKKLFSDYMVLKELYQSKLKHKKLTFILQAQRRHHGGFLKTRDLIIEVAKKTNCPITSIESFHSDGQWRFPKEIIEQTYHPYNQGYGKMSHSGYHSLDTAVWLAQSSILDSKKEYDNFELYAQVARPVDFFSQLTPEDYVRLFPEIDKNNLFSSDQLKEMLHMKNIGSVTGEIDAHALIALRHGEHTITNIGSHAVHNGFSQRNWISATGRDLYKGNGRVRHESYIIEQGPFQCVIVNSFQSHEIFKSSISPNAVGGEYHYDIHVFRNSTLFPEYKTYELITMSEISKLVDFKYSRGHQEDARRNCVGEFISAIENQIPPCQQISNFFHHELSTEILSAIYESVSDNNESKVIKRNISST
ncbi:MAG: Gfo/Idh/MocA family oxidoreductase [Candidatus Paceibacterota bacterium]|jgi:predicted dehydrogenase